MSSFTASELPVDQAVILVCQGRLDITAAGVLEERVEPILARGVKRLILDLAGVHYMSSAGLRSILVTLKKTHLTKGTMALCGATAGVLQVLELSGFRGILKNYPDRSAALRAG